VIHDWTRGPRRLPALGERPRLGVDVCVGKRAIRALGLAGCDIVAVAQPSEPDESWFNRAMSSRAHVICSVDQDLAIFCWTGGVLWVPLPPMVQNWEEHVDHILWHLREWRLIR